MKARPLKKHERANKMIIRFFYRVFSGFLLGVSVFAPGFSGSIIAIILGLYQDILRIISNPFKDLKKNIIFCIPIGIGVAVSAVLFVLTFKFLFETYAKATYLLFVGLVAGNIPVIYTEVKKVDFKKHYLFGGIGAFVAALALVLVAMRINPVSGAEGLSANWLMLALGGFAGGATALVPGMSVSMVLIIMGLYSQLIFTAEELLRMDFTNLIPFGLFGLCAVAGLVLASRGIKHIFKRYPGFANTAVLGFMGGSLVGVLLESLQINDPGFNWFIGSVMLAVGLGLSMLFVVLGKVMNKED